MLETYKAIIAYDGTDFLGYQVQASGRTVQGTVETALAQILKTPQRIIGAGRTDTGVHATGQVISMKIAWRHNTQDLHRALNATLPDDIVVKNLTTIYPNFHPRFDAKQRQYVYTILNQPLPDVLSRRYAMHIASPLDLTAMQHAARFLIGEHDFSSFGKPPQGNNAVRQLNEITWKQQGSEIKITISANAFLYRMVRNIVGTLLDVGLGKIEAEDVKHILQAKNRAKAGAPALACGLCLTKVSY